MIIMESMKRDIRVVKIQKSCKKLGSSYSKIFQLTVLVSKLYFRDSKLKID